MHPKMLQPRILKLGHVIVHSIGVTLTAHEIHRLGLSPYVEFFVGIAAAYGKRQAARTKDVELGRSAACHRLTNPASA